MQRRTLLRRSAVLGTVGLAGCLGGGDTGPGNGNGTGDGNGNGTGNGTATDTPTATPTEDGSFSGFGDHSISTTDTGCDEGDAGSASVAFEADPLGITITGVLQANTPCYEATFEGATYDTENDEIRITVATTEDGSDTCVECVGAVEYEATLNLEGGHPTAVVVEHGTGDGATVAADVTSGRTGE